MNRHNWLAIMLFGGIFVAGFFFKGNAALFVNGTAMLIVTCGTLGALFLCYPAEDLFAALQVTRNLYRNPPPSSNEVINSMIELALQPRGKGVIALEAMSEQSTISFLKRALALLVDGFKDEEIIEILQAEMVHFKQRRTHMERMFRQGALFAPAFGVAGSVVGLIDMLAGITNPDVILTTIPVALTSVLYGIVLANSVFFPVAEGIHTKTQKELLIQRLIADGVLVIRGEPNPRRLAVKLESFLTPSARTLENLSLHDIRQRLSNMQAQARAPQTPSVGKSDQLDFRSRSS
jgi:chemotaxis protein MotA